MELTQWRLIIDFGLVVLIWVVQLIIYPRFQKYSTEELLSWHGPYSRRISIIVIPLMLAQLLQYTIYVLEETNIYSVSAAILILAVWLLTFLYFVPAHQRISRGETGRVVKQLTTVNWWRTIIWSLVFLLSLFKLLLFNQ